MGRVSTILTHVAARPAPAILVPVASALAYSWGAAGSLLALAAFWPICALAFAWRREDRAGPAAQGTTDPLTGLSQRADMISALDGLFARAPDQHVTAACLVFDLDEFHRFNEIWGTDAADRLLVTTAERIGASLRSGDLVCRLEADAFAVLLAPSDRLTFDAILAVGERILRELAAPLVVDGTTTYASASAGIAMPKSLNAQTGQELLSAAERAMIEARASGRGTLRVYSADMGQGARTRHTLADEVSAALDAGDIVAWVQPQTSIDGTELVGVEALARWYHPERGPVSPGEFLPAIEAAGRSEQLSETMLSNALRYLRDWEQDGLVVPRIGVNFAAAELRSPRLVDKIRWELDRFELGPERLAVEVLETVMVESENDILLRNIRELGELGCRIDLDDFGTGSAAIASIHRFRVGRIKIDRSFVRSIDTNPDQRRMIGAILNLATELQVETLAEGVETPAEQQALADLGCQQVQGFGIARPMPPDAATAWLHAHARQHRSDPTRQGATIRAV